ncbi:restriction endonuclease subunit S [Alicyclobacillus sp. SO9]|uniref:restriction endonuclease subunit S n=1 Tax=Alicyclobacillus sp. SO9 TaxID=2665646 RepID=UPI0018E784B2|nr:restriction endonuclease subunit S [Alicyclobacillus sp. SO9]QQE80430.1 restriction endonuclease subunit S [Alicyclobacillus sp. SO9]
MMVFSELPSYQNLKTGDQPWWGQIPSHWESRRISQLFYLGRGRVISKEELAERPGPYPVYSSQTENDGEFGRLSTYDFDGDFLTWTTDGANAGTVFRRSGKFNCTNVCGTLAPRIIMDLSYFRYALSLETKRHVRLDINPKLMNNEMSVIKVLLPPLDEQKRIGSFLNFYTAKLDELIEKKQRLIELLQEKRQALITQAVTKGLDPNVPMKESGIEWLGEVPAHWEIRKLKFLATFRGGGTPSKDELSFWNGEIPWVSPKDMKNDVIVDTEDHITNEAIVSSATSLIRKDSILIVVRSGILQHSFPVAINSVDVTLNQDMKGLVPAKSVSPQFLFWLLKGSAASLLFDCRKVGATVDSLDMESLYNFSVTVPPRYEQDAISSHLEGLCKTIDAAVGKITKQITLFLEYRQAIISAAVTGQIDVRNYVDAETEEATS